MKRISNEEEEIGIFKCRIRSHIDIINDEGKGKSSEEEETGICKCGRRSRVDIINEKVKEWTSSSEKQEDPPEPTNTKEEIRLYHMKIKGKRGAI